MRLAFALAALVAFAAAPSAQSVFDQAPSLDQVEVSVLEAEAPALSADVDLSDWVAPATVDAVADDAGFQEGSRAGTGEAILYWGSLIGTTAALAAFASLYL